MRAADDRAPDATNTEGEQSGQVTTSKIPQFAAMPWLRKLGCPAGCLLDDRGRDVHECGVGDPVAELPVNDKYQRGGRDLDWNERAWIGQNILDRMRGAA